MKVIIISWPSGVGKNTIIDNLEKKYQKFKRVITYTTRPKRDYETDWVDRYFVSKQQFEDMIKNNQFIEYAIVHRNYYWSTYEELEKIINSWKIPIYEVDPQWAMYLKDKLTIWEKKYEVKTIFLLPPSVEELKKRLFGRSGENQDTLKRLKESIQQMKQKNFYDFQVINDNIQATVEKIYNIIK